MSEKTKTKPDEISWMGILRLFAILFVVYSLFVCWLGFVMQKLWHWFIVPVFNAPEIPLATAAILCLIITRFDPLSNLMKNIKTKDDAEKGWKRFGSNLFGWFMSGFLALIFGYVFHLMSK